MNSFKSYKFSSHIPGICICFMVLGLCGIFAQAQTADSVIIDGRVDSSYGFNYLPPKTGTQAQMAVCLDTAVIPTSSCSGDNFAPDSSDIKTVFVKKVD